MRHATCVMRYPPYVTQKRRLCIKVAYVCVWCIMDYANLNNAEKTMCSHLVHPGLPVCSQVPEFYLPAVIFGVPGDCGATAGMWTN